MVNTGLNPPLQQIIKRELAAEQGDLDVKVKSIEEGCE